MPDINGFEVLERLAAQHLRVPVVVITGHDQPGNAERVRALGALDYLLKPLNESQLLTAIGKIIKTADDQPITAYATINKSQRHHNANHPQSQPPRRRARQRAGFHHTTALFAQDAATDDKAAAAELAKKLSNPVASLISVPIQNNWDFGIGSANAMRYTANIQPVIPISLSEDWNLITRTIVPVIYAQSPSRAAATSPAWATSCKAFGSRPKRRRAAAGFGAPVPCCFIPPGRMAWARATGARGRRRSR